MPIRLRNALLLLALVLALGLMAASIPRSHTDNAVAIRFRLPPHWEYRYSNTPEARDLWGPNASSSYYVSPTVSLWIYAVHPSAPLTANGLQPGTFGNVFHPDSYQSSSTITIAGEPAILGVIKGDPALPMSPAVDAGVVHHGTIYVFHFSAIPRPRVPLPFLFGYRYDATSTIETSVLQAIATDQQLRGDIAIILRSVEFLR